MASQAWKAEERAVAKIFGTTRALMKGTDEKNDIIHPVWLVDSKLQNKWCVKKWFKALLPAAKTEGKTPLLTLRTEGERLRLVVMDDKAFKALLGAWERENGDATAIPV